MKIRVRVRAGTMVVGRTQRTGLGGMEELATQREIVKFKKEFSSCLIHILYRKS